MRYLVAMFLVFSMGCGSEGGVTPDAAIVDVSNVSESATPLEETPQSFQVLLEADVPACDSAMEGHVVYISSLEKLKFCRGTVWVLIEIDSPAEAVTESVDPFQAAAEYSLVNTDNFCDDGEIILNDGTVAVEVMDCYVGSARLVVFDNGNVFYSVLVITRTWDNLNNTSDSDFRSYSGFTRQNNGVIVFDVGVHKQSTEFISHGMVFVPEDDFAQILADVNGDGMYGQGDAAASGAFEIYGVQY